MKRTLFEKQPVYRKICILVNTGTLIFEYKLKGVMHSLYALDLYFVEVISTGSITPKIERIILFTSGERLNHYARLFSDELLKLKNKN
ncbi:hypothetical protein NBT05_14225 [Aquimarina sp. ERC-38]|uniref:hypothetical protein n=1 Tax=Aquimarina sp. ERC-38 TaxID=2949996 RepID=UPI0022467EEB|nr:hypothetical protein [Aquimarina sp. ERC-38]UZO80099.1 hypothetical protein NBT05_14225 [Aquimarina sp. ERC-38]